jgi:uncharacterized protein
MTFQRTGSNYILRLFKGEELIETLKNFAQKYGISSGMISAIGATDDVTIGYYDVEQKDYKKQNFKGNLEILSLLGNVTRFEEEAFFHLHVILGDEKYKVWGGHLFSATVNPTCEVIINALDTVTYRKMDKETGLKLLKL